MNESSDECELSERVAARIQLEELIKTAGDEDVDVDIREQIRTLLGMYPDICQPGDKEELNQLPLLPLLHTAIIDGLKSPQIIQLLISSWPEALQWTDDLTDTPLLLACNRRLLRRFFPSHHEVFRLLITPESARIRSKHGECRLPLHEYCFEWLMFSDIAIIQMLVEAWPEGAAQSCYVSESKTSLFGLLCGKMAIAEAVTNEQLDLLRYILQLRPETVKHKDVYGETPLYDALKMADEAAWPLIEWLVQTYPEALVLRSDNGDTPIHAFLDQIWCRGHEKVRILQRLLEMHPECLYLRGNRNYTLLHYFARCYWDEDDLPVAHFLVERSPDFVRALDTDGRTPLHLCCLRRSRGDLPLIRFLVDTYPDALAVKAKSDGATPFDVACRSPRRHHLPPANVLGFLAQKCPEFLERDGQGGCESPLFALCASEELDQKFARCLSALAISEKAVSVKNSLGQTPLHVLSERGAPRDILQILVDKCPALPRICDKKGQTPLHVVVKQNSQSSSTLSDLSKCDAVVKWLLELFPGAIHVRDNDRLTPLQRAWQEGAAVSLIYQLVTFDPILSLQSIQVEQHTDHVRSGRRGRVDEFLSKLLIFIVDPQ